MKTLLAPTEDFVRKQRAKLAAAASAGSAVDITLDNAIGFAENYYVVIGDEGSDTAELCQITGVAGNVITVATLALNHFVDEPIVVFRYNQRKFYGCATSSGSFVELTAYGSPVDIAVDDPQGTLLEYTGGEGYLYFKATYYNSQDATETSISDSEAVLADESTRYCSLYDIRVHAGIAKNPYIDDGRIEAKRKQAENEVNSFLNARYILPLVNSTGTAEIPDLVKRCTILLAAGYIDYEEYQSDSEGVKWLGEARGILGKLQTPGGVQLLGSDLKEMQTHQRTGQVRGYPNAHDDCEPRFFTTKQRF